MHLSAPRIRKFQQTILTYHRTHDRPMPWRSNVTPYRVFVSEVMLQQTQVPRVIEKFNEWMRTFPSFRALANASFTEVLRTWSGLGYNRRAKYLHEAAQTVATEYAGRLPRTVETLDELPGIGHATACAIAAFAYNEPVVFIETNIRSVYLHFFFPDAENVSDTELLPVIERTLYTENPREWYWALMDYGVYLKSQQPNPSRRSKHHTKQSRFEGSNRQVRGAIIRTLVTTPRLTEKELMHHLKFSDDRITENLRTLAKEGLIKKSGRFFTVA